MPDTQMKGDFSSILQSLLSNPQLLSTISSMIGSGANQGASAGATPHIEPPPMQRESARDESEMGGESVAVSATPIPFLQNKTHNESKEKALLCALKPFLPSKKCQTIDSFIRILDIVSLVGGMK